MGIDPMSVLIVTGRCYVWVQPGTPHCSRFVAKLQRRLRVRAPICSHIEEECYLGQFILVHICRSGHKDAAN